MANTLTLDALKQQIEDKYGPFNLEGFPGGGTITLLPIMRLPRERRAEFGEALADLTAKQKTAEDADATDLNETIDSIVRLLTLVCEKPKDIDRIKSALGDDGQAMLYVWEQYQEATKPGEVLGSAA